MSPAHPTKSRIAEVLRASAVFGWLDDAVLADLARHLELREVTGGSTVFAEGDPSESMLIVVSGRLRVSRRDAQGKLLLYNEISPGECVGETGLILRQPRAADVTAVRDSALAFLHREGFEALLRLHPLELNRVFSQAIYNQLRHQPQKTERRRAQSYAVIPLDTGAAAFEVAMRLREALASQGEACHVSSETDLGAADDGLNRFEMLESDFDFVVYEADAGDSAWTRRAFRQADQLIFVAEAGQSSTLRALEGHLAGEPGFALKRQHLVILHGPAATAPVPAAPWRAGRNVERIYPLRAGHGGDFARISRFLTGTAVGLVLGGGGARGFAHLGVLRAFAESGIPIDLIGGNSMGALIAAQYACGWSLEEIQARTRRFALGGERPTLPVISLLSGKRMQRDLRRMFGELEIDQLWLPFFAAACNLSKACTTVQDQGPLWQAVLASNSPAGLLPPVLRGGELLVDGAILDNVPVNAMRMRLGAPEEKRRGNGTVVAVDVDVREDLVVHPDVLRLSAWRRIKGYFSAEASGLPGIGDILYRAGHIGGLHQRPRTVAQADLYLEPPVAGFALLGYRRDAEIVEVGYRYAMEKIGQWDRRATLAR